MENFSREFINIVYSEANHTYAALTVLMYSTAICYDLHEPGTGAGWSERYCYEDPELALAELTAWHARGLNDQRPIGWVACRGVTAPTVKASFDKYYGKHYAQDTLEVARAAPIEKQGIGLLDYLVGVMGKPKAELQHHLAYWRMQRGIN